MPSYELKVAVYTTVVVQDVVSPEEAEEMAEDECWQATGSFEVIKIKEIPPKQKARYEAHADLII